MPKLEEWLPILGFEGYYEVSDLGRVRSLSRVIKRGGHGNPMPIRERILKQPLRNGYPQVSLAKKGVISKCYVHRLVLTAFRGEAHGMEACHGNDIRTDNRLVNLRWDTHKANVGDAIARGRHRCISEHNPAGRTHCQRGHLFDEANTIVDSRNRRSCRECRRIKDRERYHRNQSLGTTKLYNSSAQTHCKRGHEFTAENTYVRANGKRNCIKCRRLNSNAWYHQNKKAA